MASPRWQLTEILEITTQFLFAHRRRGLVVLLLIRPLNITHICIEYVKCQKVKDWIIRAFAEYNRSRATRSENVTKELRDCRAALIYC